MALLSSPFERTIHPGISFHHGQSVAKARRCVGATRASPDESGSWDHPWISTTFQSALGSTIGKAAIWRMVDLASEMAQLWTSLGPSVPGFGRVVSFVSATPGEGVSTIAREFAAFAAERVRRNVWLVELGVPDYPAGEGHRRGSRERYGPARARGRRLAGRFGLLRGSAGDARPRWTSLASMAAIWRAIRSRNRRLVGDPLHAANCCGQGQTVCGSAPRRGTGTPCAGTPIWW